MDTALEIKNEKQQIHFLFFHHFFFKRDLHKILPTTQIIKRHTIFIIIELYLTRDRTIYHNSLYNIIAYNT